MKKSEAQADIGYTPISTVAQILKARAQPPQGRAENFAQEFARRFGCSPDEAHEMRKKPSMTRHHLRESL